LRLDSGSPLVVEIINRHSGHHAYKAYILEKSGATPKAAATIPQPKIELDLTPTLLETSSECDRNQPGSIRAHLHKFAVQAYCRKVKGMDRPRASSASSASRPAAAVAAAAGAPRADAAALQVLGGAAASAGIGAIAAEQHGVDRKRLRQGDGVGIDVDTLRAALGPMFAEFRISFENTHRSAMDEIKTQFAEEIQKVRQENVVMHNNAMKHADAIEVTLKSEIQACNVAMCDRVARIEEDLRTLSSRPPPSGPPSHAGSGYAGSSTGHDGNFVPGVLFVRGWAPYTNDPARRTGISQERALQLEIDIKAKLKHSTRACIKRTQLSGFKVYQIVFVFEDRVSTNARWDCLRDFASCLQGVTVEGMQLFATLESPPWKKARNGALGKAQRAMAHLKPDLALKTDWPTGELWCTAPEMRLGHWNRNCSKWVWFRSSLDHLGVDEQALHSALGAF
jgi:hypothetical protein